MTPSCAWVPLVVLAAALAAGCQQRADRPGANAPARQEAVASVRSEPKSFNRHAGSDSVTDLMATLTQAKLVRINKQTQEVEPWLAERVAVDQPGRRYTITLRPDVAFSDGQPLTADDVLFSFAAVYDPRAASSLASSLKVGGKPLEVASPDPRTITVTFPSAFAPGVRILDHLPILPRHKLGGALADGTFKQAWSLTTPPSEIVGLGPFVLAQYTPGQRIVFDRNPHYWRKDARGGRLPYLDRLTIEIIPDANAELLRLQAGQLDITASEVPPESYASVKRAADAGKVKIVDVGVALDGDSFWFNLKPGAFAGDPRAAWLQRDELRRAISMAVDRQLLADTVYFGAGEPVDGPETPSNKGWYSPDIPRVPHDPAAAQRLLASIGASNARFTLLTQKGRPRLERGASVIRDELKKIGLTVDVVAMDANALIERILGKQYEAVYFNPQRSDTDPAINQEFWLSSGGGHFWNMLQPRPATDWERRLDELTEKQIASADDAERHRIYKEMLTIFAEHQPVVYFAAPRMYVALSARVTATPAVAGWPVLWQPDTIAVAPR
jgi:peptide/nickel transport system substrate-binding protein